jgi:4-amino-4-deoxy-L-arabinose transferase-like glycosyltransferase
MKPGLAGLLVVAACFCLPLFVGLGRAELRGDEAGHSFSVDRILETGDWLVPKASPQEDFAFLEKPPLKFWIVALPIRAGLLPHDEFGLRFWDAVFGSLAFLYVYAIGARLGGAVCGAASVLVLFVFHPLVFDHGLRTNNMEAALLLCYCGGVYHFMAAADRGSSRWHPFAVASFFALGFMTKFVAAIFLPFVLLVGSGFIVRYREAMARRRMSWLGAAVFAFALIAPWFVYATVRFGRELWFVMLGQHVIERMTASLDAEHVQPWSFYWVTIYKTFSYAGALVLVGIGFVVLAIQAVRRQWPDAALVVIWGAVPLALISFGTSKLIHYLYPFVPPFALAAGYLASLIVMLAPAPVERIKWPRVLMASVALLLAVLAAFTAASGEVHLSAAGHVLFRNSAVYRPGIAALVAAALAMGTRRAVRTAVLLAVLFLLPVPSYAESLRTLNAGGAPLRELRDCLLREEAAEQPAPGMLVDVSDAAMQHHTYYYMRGVRPWTRADSAAPVNLERVAQAVRAARPMLFSDERFRALVGAWRSDPSTAGIAIGPVLHLDTTTFVLPGRYAACQAAVDRAR